MFSADLIALIQDEPMEPGCSILNALKQHDGKRLTKLVVEKVSAAVGVPVTIAQSATMTYLEWGGFRNSGGKRGGQMFIAYAVKNVVIDIAFILEHNRGMFDAREERNKKRAELRTKQELFVKIINLAESLKVIRKDLDAHLELCEGSVGIIKEALGLD